MNWRKGWSPVLVLLLFLLVWELAVRIFNVPAWLLPSPVQIGHELITGVGVYSSHLVPTVQLTLAGLATGSVFGVITAVLLHNVPFLREAVYPLIIISQNIPTIVLAPLLVIWFGFGTLPKLIVIILVCFFPVTVALLDGFRRSDPDLMNYMKMAGATKRQIFWKLEWPQSLPSLFSGLKISATYSVMGAVISEWLGARQGIGVYMTFASSSFRTDRVFVAIFFIVLFSLTLFLAIQLLEKIVIRWHPKEGNNDG